MSGQPIDGAELPVAIDDTETIVRAIVAPSHVNKKGRVTAGAFRPPPGKSAISVMRQLMRDDACKARGLQIGRDSPGQTYKGLLAIRAARIREAGSTVTD